MNPILSKNFVLNNKFFTILLFLIFLIPLSLIIGNAATNINIILITIFFLSKLIYDKNLKFLIYDNNLAILIFFIAIAIKDNFFYEGFNLKSIYFTAENHNTCTIMKPTLAPHMIIIFDESTTFSRTNK